MYIHGVNSVYLMVCVLCQFVALASGETLCRFGYPVVTICFVLQIRARGTMARISLGFEWTYIFESHQFRRSGHFYFKI